MRSKFWKQIFILLLVSIIFTSCTLKTQKPSETVTTNESIQDEKTSNIQPTTQPSVQPTIQPTPTTAAFNNSNDKDTKPESKSLQKNTVSQHAYSKNNTAGYDNTLYSWWYKKGNGTIPEIPKQAENLIKKYDGIYAKKTTNKEIYLTFDEGYENGYTPKILDTLKANHVKAAFFITGPYLKNQSALVKRMLDEGHIVGNHTVNHPSMPGITDDNKLEEEIIGLERSYYEMFGEKMTFLRPPKGEYSERTLAITQSLGYKTVFWSFAYQDWDVNNQKGTEYAYNQIKSGVHNGAVLLLHAVSKDNAEFLDKLIKDLKAEGYVFKSLNEF